MLPNCRVFFHFWVHSMRKRESLSNNQHILNIKISTCYETVHCTVSPKFINEFGATCLLCFAQFTLVRFSVLYIKKGSIEKRYFLFWRRRRDSNSRAGYPTYALSRGASSPTWVLLQADGLNLSRLSFAHLVRVILYHNSFKMSSKYFNL